jgi:hypothetical protein
MFFSGAKEEALERGHPARFVAFVASGMSGLRVAQTDQ